MSRPPLTHSNSPRWRPTRARDSVGVEGKPPCPRTLTPDEKKIFRQICRELAGRRALTKGDGPLITLYCETVTRHRKAMVDVTDRGEIITSVSVKDGIQIERQVKNPWLVVAQESEKQMRGYLSDLGLSPSARERVKPVKKEMPKEPELDEFEKVMGVGMPRGYRIPGAELPS